MSFGLPIQNGEAVEYNGWRFSEQVQTVSCDINPVKDAAGRTITHNVITLVISDVIQSDAPTTTDAQMTAATIALLQPACAFNYLNKGMGNMSINVPGGIAKDVLWGPFTKLKKDLRADAYAWNITFTITVATLNCPSFANYQLGFMELNFSVGFSYDKSGYATRKHSGHAIIPQTRAAPLIRTLAYTADQLREIIYIAPLQGFRRVSQEFNSDDSKCRMDWNYVDELMPPNIPPPNVVEVRASHRLENNQSQAFGMYTGTIEATYEMAFATPAGNAFALFWKLVNDRISPDALAALGVPIDPNEPIAAGAYGVWPLTFSPSEPEIYGRSTAQFSFSYMLSFAPAQFLAAGLWRPVPGQNWGAWSKSMAATQPRGLVPGLGMYPADDIIVDLCVPQAYIPPTSVSPPAPPRKAPVTGGSMFKPPKPKYSYGHYQNDVSFHDYTSDVVHKPLPTVPLVYSPPGVSGNAPFAGTGPYLPSLPINPPPALIQTRTAPTFYAVMTGMALRAAYPIAPPALISVGGVPAVLHNLESKGDGYRTFLMGDASYPIYGAVWQLRYVLPMPPNSPILPPANPMYPDDSATATLSGGGGTSYPVAGG